MKSFIAFTRKEFLEQIRTYKLFILLSVFFLFGMMSPLLAKLLPDIIGSIGVNGIKITLPEPTYIDAYSQFFKNLNQLGIIIILLIFSGTISQELNKGTLINMLSKGLSRTTLILSKYVAAITTWTIAFIVAAGTNYFYTLYLFGEHSSYKIVFSLLILWLFGTFVLAVLLFSSILASGNYGGLLICVTIIGGLLLVNIVPNSYKYNPISLVSKNMDIINGTLKVSDMTLSTTITILSTVILILSTIIIFKKKKV